MKLPSFETKSPKQPCPPRRPLSRSPCRQCKNPPKSRPRPTCPPATRCPRHRTDLSDPQRPQSHPCVPRCTSHEATRRPRSPPCRPRSNACPCAPQTRPTDCPTSPGPPPRATWPPTPPLAQAWAPRPRDHVLARYRLQLWLTNPTLTGTKRPVPAVSNCCMISSQSWGRRRPTWPERRNDSPRAQCRLRRAGPCLAPRSSRRRESHPFKLPRRLTPRSTRTNPAPRFSVPMAGSWSPRRKTRRPLGRIRFSPNWPAAPNPTRRWSRRPSTSDP